MLDTGLRKHMSIYLQKDQWEKAQKLVKKYRRDENISNSKIISMAIDRMYDQEILMNEKDIKLHNEGKE